MAYRAAWAVPLLLACLQPSALGQRYYNYYNYGRSLGAAGEVTGCTGGTCGVNAHCVTSAGRPVCACQPGYSGDPLSVCTRGECVDNSECPSFKTCQNDRCVNPCDGSCGLHANCEVRNHVPVCSCPVGYTGNPFSGCRLFDPEELCHPSPCGVNTQCSVKNGSPTCSCLPGYRGNALTGCRHECESDGECGAQQACVKFKCESPCKQCGRNAECDTVASHRAVCKCPKNYKGDPYSICLPECTDHSECPSFKPACYYNRCTNPCEGSCGIGAECNLRGLTPVCSCPRNMTGDPFVFCRNFEPADLCEPNPCGQNAVCNPGYDRTGADRPVCTCPAGYVGNALSFCQRGECQTDAECPEHRACINYACADPCAAQCGHGADCSARRHIAVCTCPPGTNGDALVSCSTANLPSSRYLRYLK